MIARARVLATAIAAIVSLAPAAARADHEPSHHVSRTPGLPDLQHRGIMSTLETSGAALFPTGGAVLERLTLEFPAAGDGWQAGLSYAVGEGKLTHEPSATISTNAEMWGRGEWVEAGGLAFGGGMAIALPTALHDTDGPGAAAARALGSSRPWEAVLFEPSTLALRPFFDMRAVFGHFVVQFRQGFDFGLSTGETQRTTVSAILGAGASYKVGSLAPGVELWELYYVDRNIRDAQRAFLTAAPFVCGVSDRLEPCVSVLTSIGRPVDPSLDHVLGLRTSVTLVW